MTFDNCTQAYAAGYAHMHIGEPGYAKKLDRDNDGIACENPPAGFKPGETQAVTQPQSGTDQLPTTGPAGDLGIAGGVLLLAGITAAVLFRRRRTHFAA